MGNYHAPWENSLQMAMFNNYVSHHYGYDMGILLVSLRISISKNWYIPIQGDPEMGAITASNCDGKYIGTDGDGFLFRG